jgi:hypothetical protein
MKIETAKDLEVYKLGYQLAMEIFANKAFPVRRKIRTDKSDQTVVEVGLLKFAGSWLRPVV